MSRLIRRIEKAATAAHNFVSNTLYYMDKGYGLRQAISLARVTLSR